jgi:hypothetical protein
LICSGARGIVSEILSSRELITYLVSSGGKVM